MGQFWWELVYFFCLILFLLVLKELSVSYDVIFIIFLFYVWRLNIKFNRLKQGNTSTSRNFDKRKQHAQKMYSQLLGDFYIDKLQFAEPHAISAVEILGLDPHLTPVQLLDIGFIGSLPRKRAIYRLGTIPENLSGIQPFIKCYAKYAIKPKLRFEIMDVNNTPMFVFEQNYAFKRGEHLIMPPARMLLTDVKHKKGIWKLRIVLDDNLLAEHHFGWTDDRNHGVIMPITPDGELSEELTAEFRLALKDELSLDELLGDEGDESARKNG